MSWRSSSKPILPWPVLALGVVAAAVALIVAFFVEDFSGGGNGGGTPTPEPTPTLPPISGTIGYITPDGNFALMDANGTNQRMLTSDGAATSVTWSPDGSVAALEVGNGAAVAVRGVGPEGTVVFEIDGASLPLWSPSGDKLAVAEDSSLVVYDSSGGLLRTFESATRPEWSPDVASVAFLKLDADGIGVPVVGNLETGEETELAPDITPAEPVYPIAWHPAGSVIAYRNHVYELTTGTTEELSGTAILWTPDGRMLLVAGDFSPADRATPAYLQDAAQGFKDLIGFLIRPSAQDIPAQLFIQKWITWTPDRRSLFYMDPEPSRETVRLYDTVAITQDRRPNVAGEYPHISPDGRTATYMRQDKVWVYPLDESAPFGVAVADGRFPAWQPTP